MEEFLLSFEFSLAIWVLLVISALGMLGLYWTVRRREKRIDIAYKYQELVRLCGQKAEERTHLERQIRDLDQRRSERDRYQAEEVRAREWLQSQATILRDIEEQNNKLGRLREQYQEYERATAQLGQLRAEHEHLRTEVQTLQQERDRRSQDAREASTNFLSLMKELDQRKAQLEPAKEHLRHIVEEAERKQAELKSATEEYLRVSEALQRHREELHEVQTEVEVLRARGERLKVENPYLADHQDRILQQWKSLEGNYQETVIKNRQQWQTLEDQFKRLRDQAQRSTSSMTL